MIQSICGYPETISCLQSFGIFYVMVDALVRDHPLDDTG